MGVEILYDREQGKAVLFCGTTDWAFGPVFDTCEVCGQSAEDYADDFLIWLQEFKDVRDPRQVTGADYFDLYAEFFKLHDQHICRECDGTGRLPVGPDETTCGSCGGAGRLGGATDEDVAVERATGETVH